MTNLEATIHLAFAFDVGYEIDLDLARTLLPVESGPLHRRKRTPESIRYRPAPLRLPLDVSGIAMSGRSGVHGVASRRACPLRLRGRRAPGPISAPGLARRPLAACRRPGRHDAIDRIGPPPARPVDRAVPGRHHRLRMEQHQRGIRGVPDRRGPRELARRPCVVGRQPGPARRRIAQPRRGEGSHEARHLLRPERPGGDRLGRRPGRRSRLRRHAPGDRVRQRPAPRIPPH